MIWRDAEGQVHALAVRIAALVFPSVGTWVTELVSRCWSSCWWCGCRCASECPMTGTKCLKNYPVIELQSSSGLVLMQMNNQRHLRTTCQRRVECFPLPSRLDHQYAIDNVMDPMHGSYLHRTRWQMVIVPQRWNIARWFYFWKRRSIRCELRLGCSTGASWLRLSIPYRKQFVVSSGSWAMQRQLMLTIPFLALP